MNPYSESEQPEMEASTLPQDTAAAASPRMILAKWLYWSRRDRPGVENPGRSGEPAWDMMLDLYIHQTKGLPTSITGACSASHVPATTALRYIDLLCELGWFEKVPDDTDKRRSLLALTPSAKQRMNSYLDRLLERLWRIAPELLSLERYESPNGPKSRP